jgi:hypothetical protein
MFYNFDDTGKSTLRRHSTNVTKQILSQFDFLFVFFLFLRSLLLACNSHGEEEHFKIVHCLPKWISRLPIVQCNA